MKNNRKNGSFDDSIQYGPYWMHDALEQACRWVWLQQGAEQRYHQPFLEKWGPFDYEVLLRILREGDSAERRCALFALGYLATPDALEVARSYLHSQDRWERWASALALGEGRDPEALALLPSLLVEDLVETIRELAAGEVMMDDDLWLEMLYRNQALLLLAKGGDPQVIPFLRRLLQSCWHLEQEMDPTLPPYEGCREMLNTLEDHLAYALGRLQAWGALVGLDLPAERVRIGVLVLLLGALRIDEQGMPVRLHDPIMVDLPFRGYTWSDKQLDWGQVAHLLLQYFGLSAEEQARFFEQVHQDIYNRSVEPDRVRGNPSEEWTDWDALDPFA